MKQIWKWSFAALLLSITVGCGGDDYNDAELREEIARLEARLAAAETVLNAYARNLFITSVTKQANGYEISFSDGSKATISNGKDGVKGADGDTWIKQVTVGDREVTFEMTDGRTFSIPLATAVSKITQIAYVPRHTDGCATVAYTSAADAVITLDFLLSPREELPAIAEKWSEYLSVKAVLTTSRATDLINLPITAFESDAATGLITVTASANNLGADYFALTKEAAAALMLSDGKTTLVSEFVPLCKAYDAFPANEIRYTTTGGVTTTPKKAVGSGITIIENSYENGQGRMCFSEELTEIGEQAFAAHATLLTVELPEGLLTVGKKSFNNCTKLIDAVIPSTVDAINDYAFGGSGLRKVTIKGRPSIGQYAFSNNKSLAAFYGPSATADHRAILQPDGVTFAAYAMASGNSYEVPAGIRTIGATAFANCGTLTSVSLPDGVTTIEAYAFYYNFALSTINLPEGITAIGEYAFMGCRGMKALTLPASLKRLDKGVFRGASALATLTVLATTPPTLDTGVFAACPTTMQIAVPASAVEQYKAAAGWSDYTAQIVAIE